MNEWMNALHSTMYASDVSMAMTMKKKKCVWFWRCYLMAEQKKCVPFSEGKVAFYYYLMDRWMDGWMATSERQYEKKKQCTIPIYLPPLSSYCAHNCVGMLQIGVFTKRIAIFCKF